MSVVYANVAGRILCENRSGAERYYAPDCQGSTMALLDDTGAVTDRYDYWSYGEERFHSGPSVTRFMFLGVLGYMKDIINKLFYVRARHYRPELATWLTVDPAWPTTPSHAYVLGNPVLFVDPSGRRPKCSPKYQHDCEKHCADQGATVKCCEMGDFLINYDCECEPTNKRNWTCKAKCPVIGNTPPCGYYVEGTGTAKTEDDACANAKANAQTGHVLPPCCRFEHCRCYDCVYA